MEPNSKRLLFSACLDRLRIRVDSRARVRPHLYGARPWFPRAFATYLESTDPTDPDCGNSHTVGHAIALDSGDNAYVAGETDTSFFPVTNAAQAAFAGPAAGLLLWVAVYLALPFALNENSPPLFEGLLLDLYYINLIWSLLNLLPIWPLDGGRMSREFFEWLLPQKGTSLALGISFVIAGLLAINALSVHFAKHALPVLDQIPYVNRMGSLYTALLFGLLAFGSFQMLQFESRRRPWDREDEF